MVGTELTLEQVIAAVERDRPFYEESGGGVTFSGGEPLLQAQFLLACLREARARGIHTAVDTCGYASRATVLGVAAWTDLFLYDLKVLDPVRHRRFTGVSLEPILTNLRALDALGASIWLRVPYVPGFNDDEANLDALGRFVSSLGRTRRVHLIPYHRLGSAKHSRLGNEDPMRDVLPPSAAAVEQAASRLRTYGLDVHVGG